MQGRRGREEVVKGGREDDEIKGSRGHIMRGKDDGENQDEIQIGSMLPISMLPPRSLATLSLFLSFSPPPSVSARR